MATDQDKTQVSPGVSAGRAALRWGWLLAAIIGAVIYLPSLKYAFVFDDRIIIVENDRIRHLDQPMSYLGTSWWNRSGMDNEYRPLTMATFALNYALNYYIAWPYHLVNLILHGINCALVWLLARRLFGRLDLALATAAIFAVHPIHIEAVSGVVGRAELLMTGFFMMAMIASNGVMAAASNGGRWLKSLGVFALAFLSICSKEHGAMLLPCVALLWGIPLQADADGRLKNAPVWNMARLSRLTPALTAAAMALILYLSMRYAVLGAVVRGGEIPVSRLDNPLINMHEMSRLFTVCYIIARYGQLLIAPFNPSPDYSYNVYPPILGAGDLRWIAAVAVVALIVAGVWRLRRQTPMWFGLLFMMFTFFIASNLVLTIGTIMAERLLYLPSAGFCILAAAAALWVAGLDRRWAKRAGYGLLALWGAVLLGQHARYLPVWESELTLFGYGVKRVPASARVQGNYGQQMMSAGNDEEGKIHLERAIEINPGKMPRAVGMLGEIYARSGDDKKALELFEESYKLNAGDIIVNAQYVKLLTKLGDINKAERILRETIQIDPRVWRSRYVLGMWLAEQDRAPEAIEYLEDFINDVRDEERPYFLLQLANSYNLVGRHRESLELVAEFNKLMPNHIPALVLTAVDYMAVGEYAQAKTVLLKVLDLKPEHEGARKFLAEIEEMDSAATPNPPQSMYQ